LLAVASEPYNPNPNPRPGDGQASEAQQLLAAALGKALEASGAAEPPGKASA